MDCSYINWSSLIDSRSVQSCKAVKEVVEKPVKFMESAGLQIILKTIRSPGCCLGQEMLKTLMLDLWQLCKIDFKKKYNMGPLNAHIKTNMAHTWIVTNICVCCQSSNVKGFDDICVPFPSVFNVVENIICGVGRYIITHHSTLRDRHRERQSSFWCNKH